MKKTTRQMIEGEMARGAKALRAAVTLSGAALYEDAISRAYYAVFHAARAALAVHEVFPETHHGVRRMFGLHLVRPGLIEHAFGDILAAEQDDREISDYAIAAEMTAEDAGQRVEEATRFLARIKTYLASVGEDIDARRA